MSDKSQVDAGPHHENAPIDPVGELKARPAPGLMPTGETPEEWKARHSAVIDRCVKFGKRETVRVRVKFPHPDHMR